MTLLLLLAASWLVVETVRLHSVFFCILLVLIVWILAKIIRRKSLLISLLLLLLLSLSIQTTLVQNWLIGQVTKKLSKGLNTEINVGHVDFSFFNKMLLAQVVVKDNNKDTLLYAGQVVVRITDWFFLKEKAELKYIGVDDAIINLHRRDSVWNYQFLVDYFSSAKKSSESTGIALDLKKLKLTHIHFLKKDEWRGEDMDLQLGSLDMDADLLDFSKKIARIHSLEFTQPQFGITGYAGKRPAPRDTAEVINNDPNHLRWNPNGWVVAIENTKIEKGSFKNDKRENILPSPHFDGNHIYFSAINCNIKNFLMSRDTIRAQMYMDTKERSGLVVKKLNAQIKFFPEAMEFSKMDIQTGKSRLRNFFAMRYKSFDDMSDFITKVKMEADFTDANIDSDDIAYFAPELKDWKKTIRITGNIRGPVADMQGKNVLINAGKNTLLNGDIHLKGLPDINKTFIDFKSNDFRTTYKDIITMIPALKKIEQPRLDRIEWLHFIGNFKGFIHDFVTSGIIETNLGTVESDVDMEVNPRNPSVYSGTIKTGNFDLGQFFGYENIGKISFQGRVDGRGLTSKTLNATLKGIVNRFDFNGYTYQNLTVNGTVAENKFNGQLIAKDSNLEANLNGLIDFSQLQPKFDFNALITKSNLKNLHFTHDSISFDGKLRFNFTGNDIDNFLGSARIYNASIYKKRQRISFDSLTLESGIVDNNKTITVVSNEFDGAIVGEFSIKELPLAFQTFLNKYYPSYIKPVRSKLTNQNFSFVLTTKKVDDYLDLFDKNLKGFNYTSITGRIYSKENLLDLNAEVPQFNYKNIAFYNVNLKGRGNLDSLAMEATLGEVWVNDSLHFPTTHIQLKSFNDLSSLRVTTSANKTLNAANISAQVQTNSDGFHIKFNPSTFDLNGKPWSIDKNGELSFSKDIVSADALKISSGDQQILINTRPSSEGSWNDIHIDLKKINIGDFAPYFVKSERLEGLMTGQAMISDPFNRPSLQFNGETEQFRLNDDSIGRLQLTADYSKITGLVKATAHSDNKDYHFDVKGIFNTVDSSTIQPINITIPNLTDTKIELLQKYLGGIFSNLKGYASGQFQIIGSANQLKYLGKIQLRDGSLKVNYTQCHYKIPSATVLFKDSSIDFGSFKINDTLGNTAQVIRGELFHNSFRDLRFDFAINTYRLLMLNTKVTDNNQFYGTMIGKANITLKGPQENLEMFIKGEPTDSSNIYLPTTTSRENADADFIVWKVYGKEMKTQNEDRRNSNFTVTLEITANNYANVFVIIDPLTRDILKANGHGVLRIKVGTHQDMDIRGHYEIDRGNYNFTFQSFIHKPFVFNEEATNYIQWSGDPYDADINIQAIYEAENVQFSGLGYNPGTEKNKEKFNSYHGPVWVIANLSDKLMKPTINFEMAFPPNSPMKNSPDALFALQLIQSDPNELNKQVAFLIVFNSFGPMTNSNANFTANEAVGSVFVNSISGAISNVLSHQFSNYFQKAFNDKSIRVNFNTSFYNGTFLYNGALLYDQTGYAYNRTNLNLSVIKSFMNERLTFTLGSALDFGLTTQQVQAASVQFLPNITADWKLTPSGKVVLTFFYRDSYSNYSLIGNHTQNSSGTSITYRKDFDRLDELLKGKKKTPPKPLPGPDTSSGQTEHGSANNQ